MESFMNKFADKHWNLTTSSESLELQVLIILYIFVSNSPASALLKRVSIRSTTTVCKI
jgi:hypothetical protein